MSTIQNLQNLVNRFLEAKKGGCLEGASEATMHDDRAYCLALAGYYLQEKRLEHIKKRKKPNASEILSKLQVNPGKPLDRLFD